MAAEASTFSITDPTTVPTYGDGALSRWCRAALYDPRDEVFVRLALKMLVLVPSAMTGLFFALRQTSTPLVGWLAIAAYCVFWGWFTPPVILMLHCTMHRPFIRTPKVLDRALPFVMSLLHGIPAGYRDHHMGMHHVEDNMEADLSSTLRYQRDSFLHFLVYFFRFFFLSIVELPLYLVRRRRVAMARRAVSGELAHMAIIAAALVLAPRFGFVAFALPYVVCRFMMMTGNWGQHAFVNTERKNNGIANSVTCINSAYNERAFNDGYHIGHHMKANRHWAELPGDFLANREAYARDGALVFAGLDFFMVSVLLWTKQYGVLARRFVRLDGVERSDADVIAMLRERVKPVRRWPAEHLGEPATA